MQATTVDIVLERHSSSGINILITEPAIVVDDPPPGHFEWIDLRHSTPVVYQNTPKIRWYCRVNEKNLPIIVYACLDAVLNESL